MCNGLSSEQEIRVENLETQLYQKNGCISTEVLNKPKRRHIKRNKAVKGMSCSNCGCTSTPLWRRGPDGEHLCNACGLYLKARGSLRLTSKSKRDKKYSELTAMEDVGNCPGNGHCNGTGGSLACTGCPAYNQRVKPNYVCANCSATTTPLWRRNTNGEPICNACGLYQKIHGSVRPVSMRRNVIKRRKRMSYHDYAEESSQDINNEGNISSKPSTRVSARVHRSEIPFAYSKDPNKRILSAIDSPIYSPNNGSSYSPTSFNWLQEVNRNLLKSPKKQLKLSSESGSLYNCTTPALSNDEENSDVKPLMSSNSSIINSFEEAPLPRHPSPIHTPTISPSLDVLPISTLIAHRQELQDEVDKLKNLLSQTTQLLTGLDLHLYSKTK